MNKNIITSVVLGLAIFVGSFLSVFGPYLNNLQTSTTTPATNNTQVEESTTATKPKIETPIFKNDSDDNEYDDDDYSTGGQVVSPTNTQTPTQNASSETSYTLSQISTHNSATSCWSTINGGVYDLTNWVNSHPGGRAAILMICGKDGSPLFNLQHGSQRKPNTILAGFKIGILKS